MRTHSVILWFANNNYNYCWGYGLYGAQVLMPYPLPYNYYSKMEVGVRVGTPQQVTYTDLIVCVLHCRFLCL